MSYTALYRKFRPTCFEDVKGQDHIVTTLSNQIRSNKIQHAYLFCGTRGTGKTSIAKLFAKAINCENPNGVNPCMECPVCKAAAAGSGMNVIEIDAASNNGVENVRQIVEEVQYPPTEGKYKVYIIDEVHMMSTGAFNALLKTLEEPPSYVVFILATTEVHKLPITILSRCQRYDFRRIGIDDICKRINELVPLENIDADEAALRYIAKAADGSMRDALSLLDQCLAFNFGQRLTLDMVLETLGAVNQEIFGDILRTVLLGDVTGSISLLEKVIMEGRDLSQFVTDLTWYLRNILLAKTSDNISEVVDMSKENLVRLKEEADNITVDMAIRFIRVLSDLSVSIKYSSNKRILTEIALIKLCKPEMEAKDDTMLSRIRELEQKVSEGIRVMPATLEASHAGSDDEESIPDAPLPKSVPEDIKQLIERWSQVLDRFGYPIKTYIKNAKPSLGGSGELLIVFEDSMGYNYFNGCDKYEDHFNELKSIINEVSGKDISIRMEYVEEHYEFVSAFPDLTKLIPGITIEYEE